MNLLLSCSSCWVWRVLDTDECTTKDDWDIVWVLWYSQRRATRIFPSPRWYHELANTDNSW